MASEHESLFNYRLAALLEKQGLEAKGEVKQPGGRRLDVLVEVGGVRVVLEGEIGSHSGALRDAEARLRQGLAEVAIAVCYPDLEDPKSDLREVDAAPVGRGWRTVDMAGLASLVQSVAKEVGNPNITARIFRQDLELAAARLTDEMVEKAVRVSNIPTPTEKELKKNPQAKGHPRLRVALLVASAALFHANLDDIEELNPPEEDARSGELYKGEWPPARLQDCVDQDDCVTALTAAWETVLALDYKSVFESAVNVLKALPTGSKKTHLFARSCAKAGLKAANSLSGRRHDLLGQVFHRILDTAANTGAFYTSDAAATLLAGLAIRKHDADRLDTLKVVDPACGTGTLLMAVARRLGQLNRHRSGGQEDGRQEDGQKLIEEVLHGYDIEAAAIQLASVSLGMLDPGVPFKKMGIHQPVYRADKWGASAGSLELYGERATASLYIPVSEQVENKRPEVLKAVPHDLVIMNPPFSRADLRHGHLEPKERDAIKAREADIIKGTPAHIRYSGSPFLLLADKLCDIEDGTIALVYPTSSCGASTAGPVWEHLFENFHLETVVTSHDPKRYYFSENMDIWESLFVLRRLNEKNRNQSTFFFNLTSNPSETSDALAVVDAISDAAAEVDVTSDAVTVDVKGFYGIRGVLWGRERVQALDWSPVKFLNPYLAIKSAGWFADGQLDCVALGDLAEVGPAGSEIRTRYERGDVTGADEHGRGGLWFNNQEKPAKNGAPPKQTMRVRPDCSLLRKPNTKKQKLADLADSSWEKRGQLLLPERFRLGPARTFAVHSDERVIGSQWVPVRHRRLAVPDSDSWEMAMCAYLNSTVGILAQIWASTPSLFGRLAMSLAGMCNIPVPDLDKDQSTALADCFRQVAGHTLLRLRDEGNDSDSVRKSLDKTLCEIMGWNSEEIERARRFLVAEPSVTGRPARN